MSLIDNLIWTESGLTYMTNLKAAVAGLRRNWKRDQFWKQILYEEVIGPFQKKLSGNNGIFVMEKDWDNLFILDACRFDLFQDVYDKSSTQGELSSVTSRGSGSVEFLQENFENTINMDTIYITANPFAKKVVNMDSFFDIDHVWIDGWDESNNTVMAETVADRAVEQYKQHPNKRLIVHFMQPHVPFVASDSVNFGGFELLKSKMMGRKGDDPVHDAWDALADGNVTADVVWKAYKKNLEYVLPIALDLSSKLDGKTVITSDHGNSFGEDLSPLPLQVYGHPNNLQIESLVKVPWLELSYKNRRDTVSEKNTSEKSRTEDSKIDDRLESLGYLN